MNLQGIKGRLENRSIFFSEVEMYGKSSVIGYEKKFKWSWLATQLNTFVVAVDFGDDPVTVERIKLLLAESFAYAVQNYNGWPRGLQSGLGVIVICISSQVDEHAALYCRQLRSGKKWAGFAVPVAVNSTTGEVCVFERNPVWGRIYYPYFRELIAEMIS